MSPRVYSHSTLVVLLLAGVSLHPQGVNTKLSGTVKAPSGEPLSGAMVVIRNAETGLTRTLLTDERGRFLAAALPVGPYLVTISKAGFQTAGNMKANLNLGDAAPLSVKLAAESATTIEVIAMSSSVDTERSSSATLISPESLTTLPIKGRGFTDFALLTPQVTTSSRTSIAIGGQRGVNTSINIDGGDYNEPFFAGNVGGSESQAPYTVSMEAIREFQVITDGANAEFGRMGGGYLNAITKNGTNDLSGSLFYYTRPQSMVAKDHQSGLPVSDFKTRQFGGSVGGPILKDKLFYFFAFDIQRESRPVDFYWGGSPSAQAGLGLDATDANVAVDPYNNDAALLARQGGYVKPADANTYFGRLDLNLNVDHTLQFRINRSTFEGIDRASIFNAFENTSSDAVDTLSMVAQWNWTLNNSWLNEFRINYVKDELPRSPRQGSPANATLPAVEVDLPGSNFYGGHQFTRKFETKRTQFTEALTFLNPTLQIKGGIDFNRTGVAEIFAGRSNGEYRFGNIDDFRNGNWNRFRQLVGLGGLSAQQAGTFDTSEQEWAAFIQGDWRPNNNWKVGLGVRYDRQEHPDFPILDVSNPLAFPMPLTAKVPTDSQVSPRLSLIWTPEADQGRTVVRFNAGTYVSRNPAVFLFQAFAANGIRSAVFSFNASQAATAASLGVLRGAGFNAQSPAQLNVANLTPAIQGVKPSVYSFDSNFKNPRSQRFNLGAERSFWDNWVFGVNSAYAKTENLERLRDINLGTPTLTAGRLVFPSAKLNSNFDQVLVYSSDAESTYVAITLSAKYQKEGSPFQAQLFYTYSKDRDNDSNERNFSAYETQNTQRLQDDWSWSARDRRHVLTGYLSYMEKRWTGIQVGFNVRYLSGAPYNVVSNSNLSNSGGFNDRPLGVERNSWRESSRTWVDLKLTRDWRLWKRAVLTASAEVFNLFNHVDRYDRVSFTGSTTERAISSPREVQLGARFAF